MTDQREPVDRDLLAETIRMFGMAVEYKGQLFNPAEVVVHTNGVTDARRLSLVWSVVRRWSRPDCAPTEPEARQLLGEIREMLTVVPEADVASASAAIEAMRSDLARRFPDPLTRERAADITTAAGFERTPDTVTVSYVRAPECTCSCITEDVRDPEEICAHPDCLFGKDPTCPRHRTREVNDETEG